MRHLLLLLVFSILMPFRGFAQTEPVRADADSLYDKSLEDLMDIKITTASREEQSLSQATSVASVITRAEIANSGSQTIYDLLKRIPGFFPSQQATWSMLTSRGLPSDGNDHFLLLVDGHQQNSIVGQGYQQQDLIPVLDKVERIEIIRGPGSVLWGSSAVMGIINVITLENVNAPKVTYSYQDRTGLQYANLIAGIGDGETLKGFYSLSTFKSDGYTYKRNGESAVNFPWGSQQTDATFGPWPAINKQREGFEIYSKMKYKNDTQIIARILKTSFNYVWDEWNATNPDAKHELGNRRAYLDIKRFLNPAPDLNVEVNVYGDYNLQNRDPLAINNSGYNSPAQDQTNEEFAIGGEAIATTHPLTLNTLKFGVKAVRTTIGPNRDARLNPGTNTPIDNGTGTTTGTGTPFSYSVPYFGTEPGTDSSLAAYFEDSQKLGRSTVFAGARYDWNDFREQGGKLLPRAGFIHDFSKFLTGKYTYNTGYLRPSAVYSKTVGYIVDSNRGGAFPISRVGSSESVQSHDVQLSWTGERNYAALTFFFMDVRNFISFDANNTPQGYKSFGQARSQGVELEAKHSLSPVVSITENVSYAQGKISDSANQGALSDAGGRTLNYPKLMANLGTTLSFTERQVLNLNAMYWTDMRYIKGKDELQSGETTPSYGILNNRVYFDVNYGIRKFPFRSTELNAFVQNIFDNQEKIGMVVNNGTYRPPGRIIGARLSYQF